MTQLMMAIDKAIILAAGASERLGEPKALYETKLDSSSNGVNQPVPELCLKADLPF